LPTTRLFGDEDDDFKTTPIKPTTTGLFGDEDDIVLNTAPAKAAVTESPRDSADSAESPSNSSIRTMPTLSTLDFPARALPIPSKRLPFFANLALSPKTVSPQPDAQNS